MRPDPNPSSAVHLDEVRLFVDAAMAAALAIVLGNLRMLELPNGGSISFAALPLIVLALTRGGKITVYAGLCAGLGHAMLGGTIVHPIQLLLDYGLATSAIALAALGRGRSVSTQRAAIIAAACAQLACYTLSGAWFFLHSFASGAIQTSMVYNAVTVIPEAIIACIIAPRLVDVWCRADPLEAMRLGLVPITSVSRQRRAPQLIALRPAPEQVSAPVQAPTPARLPVPQFQVPRMRLSSAFAPDRRAITRQDSALSGRSAVELHALQLGKHQ